MGGQQRACRRQERRCPSDIQSLDVNHGLRTTAGATPQITRYPLHVEMGTGGAIADLPSDCEIARVDGEVTEALRSDGELCGQRHTARPRLVERFRQQALDAGERAGEQYLPAPVGSRLQRAAPGEPATDAARRLGVAR